MTYTQIATITDFKTLKPVELREAYCIVREERRVSLRIKHWRAIPEVKANLRHHNRLIAKIRAAAKAQGIDLELQIQSAPAPAWDDFIKVGVDLYSPHYDITARLKYTENSPRVGKIYVLVDTLGREYATSRQDLTRGHEMQKEVQR